MKICSRARSRPGNTSAMQSRLLSIGAFPSLMHARNLHDSIRHFQRDGVLDVHSTSDDHIVVIHDDTVERTTNGAGRVAGYTLAALQELDAGAWFGDTFAGERIPTFAAVLARYKGRM